MQGVISLKPSCRSRFSTQVSPSVTQKTFLITDVMSMDFVDRLLGAQNHDSLQDITPESECLSDLIDHVHQAFSTIRDQICSFEEILVQKMAGYYADHDKEKQDLLRAEMKKCHAKIRQSSLSDSRILDDFALRLKEFEESNKRVKRLSMEEAKAEILRFVEAIQDKLHTAISLVVQDPSSTDFPEPNRTEQQSKVFSSPISPVCQTKKLFTPEVDSSTDYMKTVINILDRNYVLFEPMEGGVVNPTRVVDVKKGRILFKSRFPPGRSRDFLDEMQHLKSMNLVIPGPEHEQYNGKWCIRLYRIHSRGTIRRVSNIPLESFHSIGCIRVLEPQHLLLVVQDNIFTVINLLTRSVVETYESKEAPLTINYMKGVKLLVVMHVDLISVYDPTRKRMLSHPKFSMSFDFEAEHTGIELTEMVVVNIILFYTFTWDEEEEDPTCTGQHKFIVFQISRTGIRRYEAFLDELHLSEHSDDLESIDLESVSLNINSRKIQILYRTSGSASLCSSDLKLNSDEIWESYTKEDALTYNSIPLVYKRDNLYIDTYDA